MNAEEKYFIAYLIAGFTVCLYAVVRFDKPDADALDIEMQLPAAICVGVIWPVTIVVWLAGYMFKRITQWHL